MQITLELFEIEKGLAKNIQESIKAYSSWKSGLQLIFFIAKDIL